MKYKLYFFASLNFVLLGIGHIAAEFLSRLFLNPRDNDLYKAMSIYYIRIFGFSRSIHEYMEGFSLSMGFLMLIYGVLNLILLKIGKEFILESKAVTLFNASVCLVIVIISVLYFHWPPILLYSISTVSFFIVFLGIEKNK